MQTLWQLYRCNNDGAIMVTTRASTEEIAGMSLAEVDSTTAIHIVGAPMQWSEAFVHGCHVAIVKVAAWGKQVEVSGLVASVIDAHPLVCGVSAHKEQNRYAVRVWLSLSSEAAIELVLAAMAAHQGWTPSVVCHAPPAPDFSIAHIIAPCPPPFTLPVQRSPETESLMQRRGIDGLTSIGILEGRRNIPAPPTPMLDWTVTPNRSAPPSATHIGSTPSSTKAMKGGSSPAWGSNVVSPPAAATHQAISPPVPHMPEASKSGPQTTPSDSDPFICNGWAYPGGLNRKERRRIRFAMDEDPKEYPGAVFVGTERPDGPMSPSEYVALSRVAHRQ